MTPDGDLTFDEWAACACAAVEQLSDEIDALDEAEHAVMRRRAPPTPQPD